MTIPQNGKVATVNGVALHLSGETLSAEVLRQRACTELLRQAAIEAGLLGDDDPTPVDGAISVEATAAIEALLDDALPAQEPSDEACRRYHAAHARRYAVGARVRARHVLFAVTPGVDVAQLRTRAEACLLDMRCQPDADDGRFARAAGQWSNCPSGAEGGNLGWLSVEACAPEFAQELFENKEVGVLPRLVLSRFGFHVVEVLEREPGNEPPFESVRAAVAQTLRQQSFATELRRYLDRLAQAATLEGLEFEADLSDASVPPL
ncbi:peptidylprolyl isomerase [Paraburkholderia sp. NMBU_R16]|uniref:peptidylprolyl isomerase n=1 Tax=Paraburkholderia sp. NMBU_R16 TaxID=2698676 RepID=UPI001563E46E|nr:peptidylprolyl isomerase [Paraburkholderia sp. NMBU_R16]NRO98581.1 peptidylprolyl isomerase [Paraburkholderia sp. NMBU_R16]